MRRAATVLAVALAAAGLAGCGLLRGKPAPAPPPLVVLPPAPKPVPPPPRVVYVPAAPTPPKSCLPRGLKPPPRYPDTDAALRAAPGAADRYQLMAAGRMVRKSRLEELERAIAGCR